MHGKDGLLSQLVQRTSAKSEEAASLDAHHLFGTLRAKELKSREHQPSSDPDQCRKFCCSVSSQGCKHHLRNDWIKRSISKMLEFAVLYGIKPVIEEFPGPRTALILARRSSKMLRWDAVEYLSLQLLSAWSVDDLHLNFLR